MATAQPSPATTGPAAPAVIWKFTTGGQIWSSATHRDGILYFGSDDNCMYALRIDKAKPKLVWRTATGSRIRSQPALDSDSLFFSGDDGFLHALNLDDGSVKWRKPLGSTELPRVLPSPYPPYSFDYMQSSPIVQDGVVFVGSANGDLLALAANSGKAIWTFTTKGPLRSSPRTEGGRVFIGSWDGHIYALDQATGELIWKHDTGGVLQATPTVGDGLVFIGSRNPKHMALDAETGAVHWEYPHKDGSWVESTSVLDDDVLYIGSSDALALFAHDPTSGELLWKFNTDSWNWGTPAVDADTIYIGGVAPPTSYRADITPKRGLWAIDRDSHKLRWHLPTEKLPGYVTGGVFATPVIIDAVIYVGSLDGSLYALRK